MNTVWISARIALTLICLVCFSSAATAQATSQSNEMLKKALRQYPDADTNGDGILTMREAIAFRNLMKSGANAKAGRSEAPPITHANVRYGPHDRNVLDLWVAESDRETPLLICIHGGGFSGGDKSKFHRSEIVPAMLDQGVSVATINYRLTDGGKNPYPIPMHDGARAVQYLRHKASEYNLDKKRFAATGGSAGGTIALWLGFHDDLADPDSEDPVLCESTRLAACAPVAAQPSVHLPTLLKWFEVESLIEHPGGRPLFGVPPNAALTMTQHLDRVSRDASPITHLTKDDPPVFFAAGSYKAINQDMSPNVWVHHPLMGIKLKEAMDQFDIESHVMYPGGPEVKAYNDQVDFLLRKLKPNAE